MCIGFDVLRDTGRRRDSRSSGGFTKSDAPKKKTLGALGEIHCLFKIVYISYFLASVIIEHYNKIGVNAGKELGPLAHGASSIVDNVANLQKVVIWSKVKPLDYNDTSQVEISSSSKKRKADEVVSSSSSSSRGRDPGQPCAVSTIIDLTNL